MKNLSQIFQIGSSGFDCETSPLASEGCPPQLSDLQGVVLRVVTVGITLLGLILLAMIVKNAIGLMMARDNEEARMKAMKGLQYTIAGFVGILLSYTIIVFIANWLGLSGGKLSFVQGGRIIFDLMLPDPDPITP